MMERTQERTWKRVDSSEKRIRLRGAQRALAQWAIVDDYDAVLDMRCGNARLLRYLAQKYSLRVCGIAEDAQSAKALQSTAPEAEVFCARREDIPWRDECFDAVFYQISKSDIDFDPACLSEALRVLKPNGQMLVALRGAPELLCSVGEFSGIGNMEGHISPRQLLRSMERAGFGDVSYRIAQPFVGIAMGWKRG